MTKMQLKAMFLYGWNAYEYALVKQDIITAVSTLERDEVFEELIQRDYIAALITEPDSE